MSKYVAQETIWVLRWNFQGMPKGEDCLTKSQFNAHYFYAAVTATFTIATTATTTTTTTGAATSVATTCKVKRTELKISRSI